MFNFFFFILIQILVLFRNPSEYSLKKINIQAYQMVTIFLKFWKHNLLKNPSIFYPKNENSRLKKATHCVTKVTEHGLSYKFS